MNTHIDWMSVALSGHQFSHYLIHMDLFLACWSVTTYTSRNLSKIDPNSNIDPPPFLNEGVAKGDFPSKTPIYATVHCKQEAPKEQQ